MSKPTDSVPPSPAPGEEALRRLRHAIREAVRAVYAAAEARGERPKIEDIVAAAASAAALPRSALLRAAPDREGGTPEPSDEDVARAMYDNPDNGLHSCFWQPWDRASRFNREQALEVVRQVRAAIVRAREPGEEAAALITTVRTVARQHGYAVGVHGSLARDIDLMAMPWTEDASEAAVLAEAVRVAVGGDWPPDRNDPYDWVQCGNRPQPKPHGRLGWAIHLTGTGTYLDLSVMPPRHGAASGSALRRLVADDAFAMTFQTMGQYRSALLRAAPDREPPGDVLAGLPQAAESCPACEDDGGPCAVCKPAPAREGGTPEPQKEALMAASAEIHMALGELQDYRKGAPRAVVAALKGLQRAADIIEKQIAALRSRPGEQGGGA